MNPFHNMALVLTRATVAAWNPEDVPEKGLNRSERIRCLLRAAHRPVTAAEIAFDMEDAFPNFGSHLVWLLMKYDIAKGRVLYSNGLYSWSHEYESAEATALREAERLLRRHGYKLVKP